jgi:sugar/nucleoside kinase (ribokinase family)
MRTKVEAPLAIVGNLNVDLWVRTVDRFPVWSEEWIVDSARPELAGTAGYLMLACKGLGIDALTVSTIGDDLFGRFLEDQLQELGFAARGIEVVDQEETPLSMIFVGEDGQRGILSTLGAHKRMDMDVVWRHDELVAQCSEVFLCGNYLLPQLSPADVLPYAQELKARGQLVAFDPSWDPTGWGEQTRRNTYRLLQAVDVYLPNEEELTHLTGKGDWHAALQEVAGMPGEVVLKRGAHGAVYAGAGEWIEVPGFVVHAVNMVGAGDVFDIGYLWGRRMGWSPLQRVQFACALATMVVSQPGTRTYPDAAGVLAFLQQHSSEPIWQTITF